MRALVWLEGQGAEWRQEAGYVVLSFRQRSSAA